MGRTGNEILSILKTYLCVHGLLHAGKFTWTYKSFAQNLVCAIFIIVIEMNKWHSLICRIFEMEYVEIRHVTTLAIVVSLDSFLKVAFYIKRRKLITLLRRVLRLHSFYASQSIGKYNCHLILILILTDVYTTVINFTYFMLLKAHYYLGYLGDDFVYGYIESPHSTPVYYISAFFITWGFITPFITIYFCYFCFVLKLTIKALRKMLVINSSMDLDILGRTLNEILNLILKINKDFHSMILLVIAILLFRVFYYTYDMLLHRSLVAEQLLFGVLNIFAYFFRFVAICASAASVSNAADELKKTVKNIPVKRHDRWKFLCLMNNVNENYTGFKLLDSLVLDRNLILTAVGSLITYGIIIATFNTNTKPQDCR